MSDETVDSIKGDLEIRSITAKLMPSHRSSKYNSVEEIAGPRKIDSFSDYECAELDKAGIKILGIEFEYDDNDRSWADGQ